MVDYLLKLLLFHLKSQKFGRVMIAFSMVLLIRFWCYAEMCRIIKLLENLQNTSFCIIFYLSNIHQPK